MTAIYRLWYAKNRERVLAQNRQWKIANAERYAESCRTRAARPEVRARQIELRKGTKNDPTRYKRAKNGFSVELVERLTALQEGSCAICRAPFGSETPHADHDHVTMSPRGMLCPPCNYGLGWFRDNPDRLAAAIAYLADPPAQRVSATHTPKTLAQPSAGIA